MPLATQRPPVWLRAAAIILLLWNLMGVFACIQQFRLGADAMGLATAYDRALYASMPAWYDWVYALAVGAGAAGTVALLARRPAARPLYVLSLIACIAQFGYLFVTSDIIAVKGVWVIYFPAVIIAIALIQIWLAGHAQKRGWVA